LDALKDKARKLNWPDELIDELINSNIELFKDLVDNGYQVEVVSSNDIVKLSTYLGGWWKVIFGDVDVIDVKPYRKDAKTPPSTEYEIRLKPGTLIQYYVDYRFPGKEIFVKKLFYCKK